MLKRILSIILVTLSLSATAQKKVYHQSIYWLYYQNQLNFSSNIYLINIVDNRRFFSPNVQHQFIYHSRLHIKKGKFDFGGGLTLSRIYTNVPENGTNIVNEIRPVVEVSHEQPLGKIFLNNRVRLDNRFVEASQYENVFDTAAYVLRFRYRIQVRIPLLKNKEDKTFLSVRLADEIMLNSKENLFDQNRIYATFDWVLTKNFTLETGYIYSYQQKYASDNTFYSRNILRLGLVQKITLKKKE